MTAPDYRFSVAPMMEWTDRHCRVFHRLLSRHARLYTEMVTSVAVLRGRRDQLLDFDAMEHPVALQLGGSEPKELAEAARIGADWGYDEINLNVGCPSDRVQSGRFGACLMREPDLVGACIAAMRAAVSVPVTVKCRIGVDDQDPEMALRTLVQKVVEAGVSAIIVHARKAWLQGLSPKENRDIPPLDYALVHRVAKEWPQIPFVLNGGLTNWRDVEAHQGELAGVMLGRAAYQTPWLLSEVDTRLFGKGPPISAPDEILPAWEPYVARQLAAGVPLAAMTRHVLGLFHGQPGGRIFRRVLAEEAHRPNAGLEVLRRAFAARAGAGSREAA